MSVRTRVNGEGKRCKYKERKKVSIEYPIIIHQRRNMYWKKKTYHIQM
jgi:hypothetical protein